MTEQTEAELQAKAASKFTLTNNPASPGKCVVCGYSGQDGERFYLDWGQSIQFYGALSMCNICLTEAANGIGWLNEEQASDLKSEIMRLADDLLETKNERDGATNALRAYLNGRPGVGARLEGEELPKRKEPIPTVNDESAKADTESSSSVDKSRPDDSSDDNGDTVSI